MPPPLTGLSGLDIDRGEASNTRHLARLGAGMNAADIAATFICYFKEISTAGPARVSFPPGDAMVLRAP
jgi:hypothetical protein